jgi:NIPSNAP
MIVELRQYTLRPGQRDVLIHLFDRELVESQEAEGMAILGQFRDLDRPDRFVWLRGFDDMAGRPDALTRFYTGPTWRAHSAEANATMIDVSDVLLLRPCATGTGFPPHLAPRPPAGATTPPGSLVTATLCYRDRPFDEAFVKFFDEHVRPALAAAGAEPIACLQTEYAENNFPALAVRTGEHVFVWFTRFPSPEAWRDTPVPALSQRLRCPPDTLRLAPTARSLLR